ncbi:MAG: saccharopine dehydrogenase NADP-binding domain-containing protein [Anaerolineales bacterium]
MRVLVLGGAGAVCNETTRDLAEYSDFGEIVVADYNLEAAQALVEEIGDQRLMAMHFNAEDYDAMLKLFPGFDVVVNGLPWKYDLPVTKACVEVGVNGLDVSTEEDQWSYDLEAKEKDILFIPGVGATPGITNVMARSGADQMDQVEEVQINFAAFRCPAPAPGLLITFLWEFHPKTEERTYYKNGEFIWVGPFEGLQTVNFPGQIGEQEVCYIPHPETRTMPKSLGAKAVSVKGCFPPHAMRLAKAMLESGLYSEEPITVKGIETTSFEMMHEILLELPETKQTPLWAYGLVVDVIGKRDGRDITIRFWTQHPPMEEWGGKAAYYKNIAIPLSIGAQMIARGDIKAKGVQPPESVLDPGIFFAELEKRGITVKQKNL